MNKALITFRDPNTAFNDAIDAGILSTDPQNERYIGNWMYMYTTENKDAFKNIDDRSYIYN